MADINKINLFGTPYNVTDKVAQTAATEAQSTASEAKSAAEAAQNVASAAQTAASTAQNGVDDLKESQITITYSDETLNITKGA